MLKFCPLHFDLMEFSALLWGLWCVHPIDPIINTLRIVTMLVCVNVLSKILTKIVMQKRRSLLPLAVMFQSSFPRSFSKLLVTLLAVPVLAYVGVGDLLTFLDSNCTNYYEVTVMCYANAVHLFEGEKSRDNLLERCAARQAEYGAVSEARNKFAAAYKQYYAYVMLRRIAGHDNYFGCAVLGRICDRLEDFNSADYYYSVFERERAKTISKNLQNQKIVAAARVRRLLQFVPKQKLLEQFPEIADVLKNENLPATRYQNATYLCPTSYSALVLKHPKTWSSASTASRISLPIESPLDQQVRASAVDLVHGKKVFMSRDDENLVNQLSGSRDKLYDQPQGFVLMDFGPLKVPDPPLCTRNYSHLFSMW